MAQSWGVLSCSLAARNSHSNPASLVARAVHQVGVSRRCADGEDAVHSARQPPSIKPPDQWGHPSRARSLPRGSERPAPGAALLFRTTPVSEVRR
jgi:hypothetical protein